MNNNVKKVPKYWNYLPLLHTKMASTIYPNIYFPKEEYEDLVSNSPSLLVQSILIHEKVHLKEQKKLGLLKFCFSYLLNKKFRLEQEILGIKEQMKFLKENGENYDIDRKSKHFSGKEYGYLMKFEEARNLLTGLWENC